MRNTLTFFAIIIFSISANAQFRFIERANNNDNPDGDQPIKRAETTEEVGERSSLKLNNLGVKEGRVNKDFIAAIEYFKQAVAVEPDCFTCKYNMGRAYIALERYSIAQDIFENLVKENPKSADSLSSLGEVLSLRDDDKGALPLLKKSLKIDPNDSITLNNYGIALHKTGNFKKAVAVFEKAIKRKPDLAEAHNYLGLTFYQLGKFKNALKSLRLADSFEPNVPEVQNNLGVVLGRIGKKKEAHKHHLEAVRLNPKFSYAVYNLGLSYLGLKKRDEAHKQLILLDNLDPVLARSLRKVLWGKFVVDASTEQVKS